MINLQLVLLILALVCFVVSAAGVASRVDLESAGLALLTLAFILR